MDDPSVSNTTSGAADALLSTFVARSVGVTKRYELGGEQILALGSVDLSVKRGEYVSIMGPSGSGKSTLFNMIGGLDKPDEGQVFIDEVDIAGLDTLELAWLRCHKIGYIFQTFNLIAVASELENVMMPMLFGGMSDSNAQDKAADLIGRVGLSHRVLNKPSQLSDGQQQRVAVARSLANDPAIILADEPTGNLDLRTGAEIIQMLASLRNKLRTTIICATHDHKMLAASDRVVFLTDGQITDIKYREELDITFGTIGVEGRDCGLGHRSTGSSAGAAYFLSGPRLL